MALRVSAALEARLRSEQREILRACLAVKAGIALVQVRCAGVLRWAVLCFDVMWLCCAAVGCVM